MKKFSQKASILLAFLCLIQFAKAQSLYDVNTIQEIKITLSQANWDYQMDTAKYGKEGYLMAATVDINGVVFDSVGVKYKGNSSYDSTRKKNPLHINLDKFKNQKYNNYTSIKLSNGYGDPSLIREVLAYRLLGNYMHCPKSNFAKVYINGEYIGLYSSAEDIGSRFLGDHFYSNQNTFIKCNPTVNPGPTTKSNFKYINADSTSYQTLYEVKSDFGWNDLVNLCDSVTNNPASLDRVLDMDRVIWMLAFNNATVNLDSYSGVFAQNHYTYKDKTGHFNPIIWDLNMCFGAFLFAGAGGTSMGNQTVATMKQFAYNNHSTDTFWPLINAIHANDTYKRKYIAHMKTIINDMIDSTSYRPIAMQMQALIDASVLADTNKFFTYTKFQEALDSNFVVGSYTVPGIMTLIDGRIAYKNSTSEFTVAAPIVSNILVTPAAPNYNTNFTLTAQISAANINGVTLGYRFDKTLKFEKVVMYDDGAHNDGVANDGLFGANLTMQGAQMQYYMYAENNDAGIFYPARAEHEFYTLTATSANASAGQIVINEFLADNIGLQKDEYNDTEDWIELFNTTNQIIDLSNCYLSDEATNLKKWKIPANTFILPNGYQTMWTDDDSWQQILHTNFSISKDSGHLYFSLPDTTISDQVTFGTQTTNVSYGRYPNGTGPFVSMNTTYGYINDNSPLLIQNLSMHAPLFVYPNPATSRLTISTTNPSDIEIYNSMGQFVFRTSSHEIDVTNFSRGLYFVQCGQEVSKVVLK